MWITYKYLQIHSIKKKKNVHRKNIRPRLSITWLVTIDYVKKYIHVLKDKSNSKNELNI